MLVNRILKVVLVLLGVVFIVLQGLAYDIEGSAISSLMLVLLILLYFRYVENRDIYFSAFLIVFTAGHLLGHFAWYGPEIQEGQIDYYYYGANILYIISYILLVVKIASQFKIKQLIKELLVPIIILLVLDVFCVVLVTDTTKGTISGTQYALEFTYNAVIMALLSVALIDYMYRNDNKSMLFLVGSICIVFSEIIQLAYYYILNDQNLRFIYSFFLVLAFALFYLQSHLQYTGPQPVYTDEQLEA